MRNPKMLVAKMTTVLAWGLSITFVAVAIWAFAIDNYDPKSGRYFDGFGRELRPSSIPGPHGTELSPGLLWSVADTLIAILLFGLCSSLFVFARRLRRDAHDDDSAVQDVDIRR